MNPDELRNNLARVRAELGLTLRDVANEIGGVTFVQLSRIERGANTSYETGTKILDWIKRNEHTNTTDETR